MCPLCQDYALDYGWVREGGPVSPALSSTRARRKRTRWSQLLGVPDGEAAPVVPEPVLRRLTDSEAALVEAADLFNASLFRRTIEGVAKALGAPLISIVPLSGVNSELVLTFAWEITWYQYRVLPEAGQPIRLADRGADVSEIEAAFTEWNATLDDARPRRPERRALARRASTARLGSGHGDHETRTFQNFIDGEWVDAASGETFESTSPADGEPIGTFPRSGAEDVDRAVAAAKEAFEDWRLVPAPKRGEILFRFAQLVTDAQGRAHRPHDARDGEGEGRRPAATSRKRST